MTAPERDEEFEAYLERRSELTRRLREQEPLEPPEELDRIVLSRARQAIKDRKSPRMFEGPRWAFPVALAATIVITFSVVLSVNESLYAPQRAAKATAESDAQSDSQSVDAAPAAAPSPPPAAPARRSREALPAAPGPEAATAREPAPLVANELAKAEREAVAGFSAAPPSDAAKHADPEIWLQWIEQLRANGEEARAEQELELFRHAFPDHPLPDPQATP